MGAKAPDKEGKEDGTRRKVKFAYRIQRECKIAQKIVRFWSKRNIPDVH